MIAALGSRGSVALAVGLLVSIGLVGLISPVLASGELVGVSSNETNTSDIVIYEKNVPNDGETRSIGVPGPTNMVIGDMLPADSEGLVIWSFEDGGWVQVSDPERAVEPREAFIIATSGDYGPEKFTLEVHLERNATAQSRELDSGWHYLSATTFNNAKKNFEAETEGAAVVLDNHKGAESIAYRPVEQFGWYLLQMDDGIGGNAPAVNPFKGYFLFFEESGNISMALDDIRDDRDAADQLGILEEKPGTVKSECDVEIPSWHGLETGHGEVYDLVVSHDYFEDARHFQVDLTEGNPQLLTSDRSTASITGTVSDGVDGAGIGDANLLWSIDGSETTSAHGDGEFELDPVSAGEGELIIDAAGYEPKRMNVTVQNDVSKDFALDVSNGTVTGTVMNASGDPVSAAVVGTTEIGTVTDADGTFELETTSDLGTVTITHPDYQTTTKTNVSQNDSLDPNLAPSEGNLEGTVTDTDGETITNATIQVVGSDQKVLTAEDGTYEIGNVQSGDRVLTVQYGSERAIRTVSLETNETITEDVHFEPPEKALSGAVIDNASGQPVANATVGLDSRQYESVTDTDGSFGITEVPTLHIKNLTKDEFWFSLDPDREGHELTLDEDCIAVTDANHETREDTEEDMSERKSGQEQYADKVDAEDLQFADITEQTGIEFSHDPIISKIRSMTGMMYFHFGGVATTDVNDNGFQDLYFVDLAGSNELWINQGDGTFEEGTADAGIGVPNLTSTSATFADLTDNGNSDLYVTTLNGPNHLFENQGNGTFKDISAESGTDYRGFSSSTVTADFTDNGRLDLYVINLGHVPSGIEYGWEDDGPYFYDRNYSEASVFYENKGNGTFERQETLLSRSDAWDQEAVLVPNPGSPPKVYVMNIDGPDGLYEPTESDFRDQTDEYIERDPYSSFGGTVFDPTNDGEFDLYVTEKHSEVFYYPWRGKPDLSEQRTMIPPEEFNFIETNEHYHGSAHYRSDGDGYSEVSEDVGTQTFLPWGATAGDVNMNGFTDLFVTSGMEYTWYEPDALLLNDGSGSFDRAEFLADIHPRSERYHSWHPIDCTDPVDPEMCEVDGTREFYPTEYEGMLDIQNQKSSRGSVWVDLDNDGALDLVKSQYNEGPRILENQISNNTDRNYLRIDLVGKEAPPDGTGAVLTVTTDDGSEHHRFKHGGAYLTRNDQPIHVGLGKSKPDEIEVDWPTGDSDVFEVDVVNERIEIVQGDG